MSSNGGATWRPEGAANALLSFSKLQHYPKIDIYIFYIFSLNLYNFFSNLHPLTSISGLATYHISIYFKIYKKIVYLADLQILGA